MRERRRGWRPDLYVVARVLDRLSDGRGWGKGRLQAASRLNYDLFLRYVDALEARGLLERRGEGRTETIHITEEGRRLAAAMREWIHRVFARL